MHELAFPTRLAKGDFPHQPEGGGRLPITLDNIKHLLKLSGISLHYNVIKKNLTIMHKGEILSPSDLDSLANLNGLNSQWFGGFVSAIGQSNPLNPVKNWIESKEWDGNSRLSALYETVEVDADYPASLKIVLIRKWLTSGVAAATKPEGFRSRGVLTLQGDQGLGKTSWIAALVPEELRSELIKLDHYLDPHNKDSVVIGISHWITEIGELDSSFKKDVARLKGFLTNDFDKLRLPYERRPIELPRRTVFAATVNDPNFLIDRTGNSRFWTLPVTGLNYQHDIDMQQLFAELAVEIGRGATWWLSPSEEALLNAQNKRFQAVSVIEERLMEHLCEDKSTARYRTAMQVLQAIGVNYPSNQQCREAGQILRANYGAPKRVRGRSCWKVALSEDGLTRRTEEIPAEEIY